MNVLTPNLGRQTLLEVSSMYSGGMASPPVNPRGGIFGPQGYGGGIFDSSNQDMSGLGQSEGGYPWGEPSQDTLRAQQDVNLILRANQYCEVVEDSKLGPVTCGSIQAAQTMNLPQVYGINLPSVPPTCQSFTAPRHLEMEGGCTGPVAPPPGPAPPQEETPLLRRKRAGMGTTGFLVIAGVVAAGGIYFATRRK